MLEDNYQMANHQNFLNDKIIKKRGKKIHKQDYISYIYTHVCSTRI